MSFFRAALRGILIKKHLPPIGGERGSHGTIRNVPAAAAARAAKDRFWRAVVLCALTAAVFFLPFYIMDGGFFHYAGDFNSQQISFYRYMNGFLKGAGYPDSTFAGAPRNTFSWATDLGSGAMNAYSFYLYGSPFFWLSVLLPQRWLPL